MKTSHTVRARQEGDVANTRPRQHMRPVSPGRRGHGPVPEAMGDNVVPWTLAPLSAASVKLHAGRPDSSLTATFNRQQSAQSTRFKSRERDRLSPRLSAFTERRGSDGKLTQTLTFFGRLCGSNQTINPFGRVLCQHPAFLLGPLPREAVRSCCSGTHSSIRTMDHLPFPSVQC